MKKIDLVNVKMGTRSTPRYSNGNTLPFTQRPWAMAGFAPQTSSERGPWYYYPDDRSIEGVRLTHQPSPWIRDYGNLVLMPQSGKPFMTPGDRWSGYMPEKTILRPDYMFIEFLRYGTSLELTPTYRGASIKLKFATEEQPRLGLFPVQDKFACEVDQVNRIVRGCTTAINYRHANNYAMYFVMKFDCDFLLEESVNGEEGANIALNCKEEAAIQLAISYISPEQAMLNLEQELSNKTFEQIQQEGSQEWEELLGKIEIEAADEEQRKIFYSCLYRACIFPHMFHEFDSKNQPIHYCTHDGKVREGLLYTDNGFWDTFRTVYPLYAIVFPDKYAEIMQGYVNFYKDCGWLPKWPCPGEIGAMPGTLIDGVIADAAVKGIIKGKILEDAFEGMLKHAEQDAVDIPNGRKGVSDYHTYGYIPRNKYGESVNHTLDYAYGDFCIAQVAKLLGRADVAEKYYETSKYYKNLFDPVTGFMRGKDTYGRMAEDFNQYAWGGDYCEGGPWQNSFGVYHDIDGLMELYGGKQALLEKLEELFNGPRTYDVGKYRSEIHEMTEMACYDFGQCAISNQPSFHLPWLFAMAGDQEKTDYWVAKIAKEAFSSDENGYPGDEDNGSLSSWYILATLGLYSVCPGKEEYIKNKPLVERATIHSVKGDIVINKNRNGSVITYNELMNQKKA